MAANLSNGWGVAQALAFECGLRRTYISGVERDIRNPTVVVLEEIATALKVPTWRLLEESAGKVKS